MLYCLNGLQKAFSTWLGLMRIEQISYRNLSAAYPHNTANRTVQFFGSHAEGIVPTLSSLPMPPVLGSLSTLHNAIAGEIHRAKQSTAKVWTPS